MLKNSVTEKPEEVLPTVIATTETTTFWDTTTIKSTTEKPCELASHIGPTCIGELGKYCTYFRRIRGRQTIETCRNKCKNSVTCKCVSFSVNHERGICLLSQEGCTMKSRPKLTFYQMSNCDSTTPGNIYEICTKDGLYRYPANCEKYIQCHQGRRFLRPCAPGTVFNSKIGQCDFPYNVPECKS